MLFGSAAKTAFKKAYHCSLLCSILDYRTQSDLAFCVSRNDVINENRLLLNVHKDHAVFLSPRKFWFDPHLGVMFWCLSMTLNCINTKCWPYDLVVDGSFSNRQSVSWTQPDLHLCKVREKLPSAISYGSAATHRCAIWNDCFVYSYNRREVP